MKVQQFSGSHIFGAIVRLVEQLKELDEALTLLDGELGADSLPYKLLKDQYDEVLRKRNEAMNRTYTLQYQQEGVF